MSNITETSNLSVMTYTDGATVNQNSSADVNGSSLHTYQRVISIPPTGMALAAILTPYIKVLFTLVSIVFNSLVFMATSKISKETLKSKALIQNTIISDVVVGVGVSLRPLCFPLKVFLPQHVYSSVDSLVMITGTFSVYGHLLASVLLAGDRMYAVSNPLTYYTTGYTTLATLLLVTGSWLFAAILALPAVFIPFVEETVSNSPLHVKLKYGYNVYGGPVTRYVAMGIHLLIFLMYIVLFIVLYLKRKYNRALSGSQPGRGKTATSLTTTYFLIHFSSLCLYVPGPLYGEISYHQRVTNETRTVISHALLGLYFLNIVLNSVILGTRVKGIRENLYHILNVRRPSAEKSRETNSTTHQA